MPSDIQPHLLRRMTVRRIVETLQHDGPSSRAEITRSSGISAPTVSKAVASLLELGFLEEGAPPAGSLGRPGRVVRLATERAQVLGITLDVGRCQIVTAGLDGQVDPSRVFEFETPDSYESLMSEMERGVASFLNQRPVATMGAAVSTPGLVSTQTQQSLFSPNLHITDGQSPSRDLENIFRITSLMIHETHALCLSEASMGGARGLDDFAMLDMSTGLGLGVVSSGHLLSGHSGLAGELGHITVDPHGRRCGCGNRGCLETLATDSAFAYRVSEVAGKSVTFDEALQLTRDDPGRFRQVFEEACEYFAIAIAATINLFNPRNVFVHGRLFEVQPGTFDDVVDRCLGRTLKPAAADCQIMRAQGNKLQGAVAGVIQHLTDALGPSID